MGAAVAAAGVVASVVGQKDAARAQKRAYNRQADIMRQNAAAAKKQAEADARMHAFQSEKAIQGTRAGFSAAGIEVDGGGSVAAVIEESVINAEIDRLNILNGGDIRSRSYINQAVAASTAGRDVGRASTLSMLGTAFTGAAGIIDKLPASSKPTGEG